MAPSGSALEMFHHALRLQKYSECLSVGGGFFFPSCFFLCSWTANGAELEGQSTNTFPGGPEWKRAAAPQPHQLEWNTEIGQTSPGGQNVRLRPHCSMCVRWKNGIPNVQCRITKGTNFKTFWITYSRVKKRVHSLSIHSFCIRSLKKTKSGPWQILKLGQYNLHIIQCHNLFKHKFRQNTEAVF